ncbi:SIR2 family protein [Massilia sp. S19_KUP03_FR1]|uniref:SIR2 family protein n=1 Tax=Massilia sp. S19_KUP03_FR1 TaxID=3025503 RepID=UPI002FCDA9C0
MQDFDVIREARELKTQLSYSKNIGFFMGAGSSCALGLPNIAQLTGKIEQELTEPLLGLFKRVKKDLEIKYPSEKISIEDILNQTRRIREITAEREDSNFDGITGIESRQLDVQICRIIYNILTDAEAIADLTVPKRFLSWLSMQNREQSKEIFTTNYDLLIERSLESIRVPYFDGFVGSYEPFFWQESVERFVRKADLTENWIRLWKIHGSLSWFWKKSSSGSHKVVRLGKIEKIEEEKSEIVIYPSKDKYDSSRRQPFLVYFDRLRNYLLSGELLFIFTGYSFLDQHINEIIFNCLRQNNRLSIIVFFYADYEVERLHQIASGYLNLTAFGPTKAIVNGVLGKLNFVEANLKLKENTNTYWDNENGKMLLGDFNHLVNFLVENSGRSGEIEVAVNEN